MNKLWTVSLLALLVAAAPMFAQQPQRVIPPTIIPKNFKSRKVGAVLTVNSVGVARTMAPARPGAVPDIELSMEGGSTRVQPGGMVTVRGTPYKAMGWQKDHFLLFNSTLRRSLYFSRAETEHVAVKPGQRRVR